jgi:hypothetical protein
MTIVFEAIQNGYRRLKEANCYSISLHTQELDRSKAMDLADMTGQLVKVVVSDQNVNKEIINLVESVEIKEKERWTPSQRLRFAIRELQQRQGIEDQDSEEFYREVMTRIIKSVNNR